MRQSLCFHKNSWQICLSIKLVDFFISETLFYAEKKNKKTRKDSAAENLIYLSSKGIDKRKVVSAHDMMVDTFCHRKDAIEYWNPKNHNCFEVKQPNAKKKKKVKKVTDVLKLPATIAVVEQRLQQQQRNEQPSQSMWC